MDEALPAMSLVRIIQVNDKAQEITKRH